MDKKDENKHTRFKRLAEARTEKILDMLDLLGNLSNKSFYEYSDEEIKMIFSTIDKSLQDNKDKFNKKKKKKRRFTL